MAAYIADQDDDEYAPAMPGMSQNHGKRVDPSTNKPYWYNRMTGQSTWDPPPRWPEAQGAAIPPNQVTLPRG